MVDPAEKTSANSQWMGITTRSRQSAPSVSKTEGVQNISTWPLAGIIFLCYSSMVTSAKLNVKTAVLRARPPVGVNLPKHNAKFLYFQVLLENPNMGVFFTSSWDDPVLLFIFSFFLSLSLHWHSSAITESISEASKVPSTSREEVQCNALLYVLITASRERESIVIGRHYET